MTTSTADAGRAGVAPSSEQPRAAGRCPRCNGPLPLTEECPDECCPVEREEDAEPAEPERTPAAHEPLAGTGVMDDVPLELRPWLLLVADYAYQH